MWEERLWSKLKYRVFRTAKSLWSLIKVVDRNCVKKQTNKKASTLLALFYSSIPTWWWRLQRSWCHWVNRCLFLSIYPPQHGHCWPRCQPSDSECLRSCHLWDTETVWHWDMKRARSDRQTHSKKKRKKKGTNQQISQSFIFVQFFSISIFHPFPENPESQHVSPPPPPHKVYGVRWVIVPNLSAFWWCAVSATRTNTHTQTSCMSFSELCHWILGTVGACQVAVIRPTELHCCLWWHHQTQSLI